MQDKIATDFKNTGIIIARFQTPNLHKGHILLINKVLQFHKKVFIFLGVSPFVNEKNPLDFPTRVQMILNHYPNITVVPIRDVEDNKLWAENLDNMIRAVEPKNKVILYGGRDSFITYYKPFGKFECIDILPELDMSATELREEVCNEVLNSADFRAGIIYHIHNTYSKVLPTVDIITYRKNNDLIEVLLGQKHSEKDSDAWRVPGGFIEKKHNGGKGAAIAELKEETNIDIIEQDLKFIGQFNINDWRFKNSRDAIMTTLYCVNYNKIDGFLQSEIAGDDLYRIKWFDILQVHKFIRNEHKELLEAFIEYIKK
jgi:bifunctional NMN adenylyltransferase/nudix hydrolase